jgi:hypothetical protein
MVSTTTAMRRSTAAIRTVSGNDSAVSQKKAV